MKLEIPTKTNCAPPSDFISAAGQQKRSWVSIASTLLQLESSGEWRPLGYSSYSSWVSGFAIDLGIKASLLWRYRRAAIFYGQLQNYTDGESVFPAIENIGNVSPDNLDLLEKISRVLSHNELILIAQDVISKQIGRRELLARWKTLRKGLEGKTARGRGVETPRIASTDPDKNPGYIEDKILSYIMSLGPSIIGIDNPARFQILRNIRLEHINNMEFDAVIITQKDESDLLDFHTIEIKHRIPNGNIIRKYCSMDKYFDYTWLAIAEPLPKEFVTELPEHIGIISFANNGLCLTRPAKKMQIRGTNKEKLMSSILIRFLPK